MDCHEYITEMPKHKKGSHLTQEERMAIRMLGLKCYTRACLKIGNMLGGEGFFSPEKAI